jgi:hypothetical protein
MLHTINAGLLEQYDDPRSYEQVSPASRKEEPVSIEKVLGHQSSS